MALAKTLAVTQAFSRLRDWLDQNAGAAAAPVPTNLTDELPEPPRDVRAACARLARSFLWGPEQDGPASPGHQADRLAPLDPSPEQVLAWIGAGVAGGPCAAADRYGVAVDGYEWRPDWRDAGAQRIAVRDADAPAVRLLPISAKAPRLEQRVVDAAVSFERLWELRDPRPLLRAVHDQLRPGGLLLAVEWVLDEGVSDGAPMVGFAGARVLDAETWRARFTACGFDLRVEEDGTGVTIAQTRAAIERFGVAFDGVAERILEAPHGKHVVYELTRALNIALQRVAALERGDVAVCRFLAARVGGLKS